MVKFNKILAILSVSALSTLVAGKPTSDYDGNCRDLEDYLNQQNMTLDICRMSNYEITNITVGGKSINQEIVDNIAKYGSFEMVSFNAIKKIPKNLNLNSIHANTLEFTDIPYNREDLGYQAYSIPKGVLKTAKNVKALKFIGHQITQQNVNEINTLTNLTSMDFYNCGFANGINYTNLKNLKNLKSLSLNDIFSSTEGNPFSEMSESICELKKLNSLGVSSSNVITIPKCFGNLTNLKELIMTDNQITEIPEEIGQLTNLVELNLTNNKISSIPSSAIGKLSKLENLSLTDNKISRIPSGVSKLRNLKNLFLVNNRIKVIPESIVKLQKLEQLSLKGNALTDIPEFLGQLKNLDYLDLADNKIDATIPESLNELNLTSIDLDGNVDIKGKTLTIPNLIFCSYNEGNNKSKNGLCLDANSECTVEGIPSC